MLAALQSGFPASANAQEAGHFRQGLSPEALSLPSVERASAQDARFADAGSPVIQCPDWRALVSPAVLRNASERAAPGDFDAKLKAARVARPRDVSPLPTGSKVAGGDDGRVRAHRPNKGRSNIPSSCSHTIRSGETLGAIAARHLGTRKRWPDLARVNPGLDPNRLRVGAVLALPCNTAAATAGQGGSAPKAEPGAPLSGTGFLAALFGTGETNGQKTSAASGTAAAGGKDSTQGGPTSTPQNGSGAGQARGQKNDTAQTRASAAQSGSKKTGKKVVFGTAAQKTVAAPVSAKPPPPVHPIWTAKPGEDFAGVLKRWAQAAQYRVVIDSRDAWTITVPVSIRGDFETAVNQLVKGLGSDGKAPPVRIYSNKVIRLGGL